MAVTLSVLPAAIARPEEREPDAGVASWSELERLSSEGLFADLLPAARRTLAEFESRSAPLADRLRVRDLIGETLATLFFGVGTADEFIGETLRLKREAFGPRDPRLAPTLVQLAWVRRRASDHETAWAYLDQARRILDQAEGVTAAQRAPVVCRQAFLALIRKKWDLSRSLAAEGLALESADPPPRAVDLAVCRQANVLCTWHETGPESAMAEFEALQAWQRRQLGPLHPYVGITYLNMGAAEAASLRYGRATRNSRRAIEILERSLGPENLLVAATLSNLGHELRAQGDLLGARQAFERAASLKKRSGRPMFPDAPLWLAELAEEMGDTAQMGRRLDEGLQLLDEIDDDNPLEFRYLVTRARHSLLAGRREQARAQARALIARGERTDPAPRVEMGAAHALLSRLAAEDGDAVAAVREAERALADERAFYGRANEPVVARYELDLARRLTQAGRPADALARLDPLLEQQRALLGPDHPLTGAIVGARTAALCRAGRMPEAFEAALESARVARQHARLTLRGLAQRSARLFAGEQRARLDEVLSVLEAESSARGRSDDAPSSPRGAGEAPGQGEDGPAAPKAFPVAYGNDVRRAWDAVVRGRGLVLEEFVARRRAAALSRLPELAAAEDAVTAARDRLARLVVRTPASEVLDRYLSALDQASREKDRAERALAELSLPAREALARREAGLEQVEDSLAPGSALVSYVSYGGSPCGGKRLEGTRYAAFVLGAGGTPGVVFLGPSTPIDRRVQRWREEIERETREVERSPQAGERSYRRQAAELRRTIWDPVVPLLGGAERVFVVADGALHAVDLATLPRAEGGYLVEEPFALHRLPVERDLLAGRRAASAHGGLLALGGPDFERSAGARSLRAALGTGEAAISSAPAGAAVFRGEPPACAGFGSLEFPSLPRSSREIESVSRVIRRTWPDEPLFTLSGAGASEEAFKGLAAGRRVIHLATHAFFLGRDCRGGVSASTGRDGIGDARLVAVDNPLLFSGVALAGANRRDRAAAEADDGILTGEEISALDLSSVEWVVLSGCDTGAGDVSRFEGVLGLERAFLLAGARTVILSLWPVTDDHAAEWMRALYRERARGAATPESVRSADRALLERARRARRSTHPVHWAGFVAVGQGN